MKIYFVRKNEENLGPFDQDQLKELPLQANDYVWVDGTPDWTEATNLPELKHLIESKRFSDDSYLQPHHSNNLQDKINHIEPATILSWCIGLLILAYLVLWYMRYCSHVT